MDTPATPPATPIDNTEPLSSLTQPNKRSRKKSIVWEYFTVETISAECTRACCKQCKKSFAYINGTKLAGTSHLKRHIVLGICPISRQRNDLIPYTPEPGSQSARESGIADRPPKRRYRRTPGYAGIAINQERCNYELAKMIIQHEYPLNMVEHPGFISFVRTLQPQFKMVSFNTIQGDCVAIYLREKQNLLNLLSGIAGRLCLSLDMCTSDQTIGYVTLTGNFIDGDWKLHRRILNVVMVPNPDSDDALYQAVVTCLSDWILENRLFTLTIDQSILNETKIANLRGLLSIKNPLMLNGQFLVGNCYARVISRLAQEAIGTLNEAIRKVRESVKYVKTSYEHEEKFMELKQQLQLPSEKELLIDDQTKWDSTYHMLVAACELKEVFTCLDTLFPEYKETPSMDEWKQIEILLASLKLLFDSVNNLTIPDRAANFFFHEAWKIQLELMHSATSVDPFLRNLTKPLQEKFDKYWKDSFLILAIAIVMDPRFKMKLIEFSLSKIYGDKSESWVNMVDNGVHELFLEYVVPTVPPPPAYTEEVNGENGIENENGNGIEIDNENESGMKMEAQQEVPMVSTTTDGLSDFDVYISDISDNNHSKSELDQYLDESLLPRETTFDILGWWKLNKLKYPTLSRMASDILSISVCTVAPDSVFDTTNKKISSYQSSLRPVTLEALICAKDWLQYGSYMPQSPHEMSNEIVKMEL